MTIQFAAPSINPPEIESTATPVPVNQKYKIVPDKLKEHRPRTAHICHSQGRKIQDANEIRPVGDETTAQLKTPTETKNPPNHFARTKYARIKQIRIEPTKIFPFNSKCCHGTFNSKCLTDIFAISQKEFHFLSLLLVTPLRHLADVYERENNPTKSHRLTKTEAVQPDK